MIVIATNKLTGQAFMYKGAKQYSEIFNPSTRKWFHCIVTQRGTELLDSKQYRICINDKEDK